MSRKNVARCREMSQECRDVVATRCPLSCSLSMSSVVVLAADCDRIAGPPPHVTHFSPISLAHFFTHIIIPQRLVSVIILFSSLFLCAQTAVGGHAGSALPPELDTPRYHGAAFDRTAGWPRCIRADAWRRAARQLPRGTPSKKLASWRTPSIQRAQRLRLPSGMPALACVGRSELNPKK